MNDKEYLESKRIKVLETIKPICEAFNIKDYDYIVNVPNQNEILRIYDTYIGCCSNSIEAIINELIGFIVIRIYCRNNSFGAFDKQTKNYIKRYWINEDRLKELGLLKGLENNVS